MIEKYNKKWALKPYKDLGTQTMFIGEFKGGDYFNRLPKECYINGTIRFNPGKTLKQVISDIDGLISDVYTPNDLEVKSDINFVGEGFSVNEDEDLVIAIRESYKYLTGQNLKSEGMIAVADASKVVNYGKLPAIYFGTGLKSAHSNNENISLKGIVKQCKVVLGAILYYMNIKN